MRRAAHRLLVLTRGSTATIKTAYVGALTVYSVLIAPGLDPSSNAIAVVTLLVVVPISVVAARLTTQPAAGIDTLLAARVSAESALRAELRAAREEARDAWWADAPHDTRWFDDFFAFWWKVAGVPADAVLLDCSAPALGHETFSGVPATAVAPSQPDRKKAALVRAAGFLSDMTPRLICSPLDHELAQWVERHAEDFAATNPRASVFGVSGWAPIPAVISAHGIVTTRDGWVLLSLRSRTTDYFPSCWSASFEEQVEVGAGLTASQTDSTVGATVRRGLAEELGIHSHDVEAIQMLALGREYVDLPAQSVRSAACICAVRLVLTRSELWSRLGEPGRILDAAESRGWIAVRFPRRRDVIALVRRLATAGDRGVSPAALRKLDGVEVSVHPRYESFVSAEGGYGWHPTSRTRLVLWAEEAASRGSLAP